MTVKARMLTLIRTMQGEAKILDRELRSVPNGSNLRAADELAKLGKQLERLQMSIQELKL